MDNFTLLHDMEEYKNGTNFIVSGVDCGSRVTVSPVSLCKPFFPDFEMPPVTLPTKSSTIDCMKPISPTNDSAFPKDISSKTSLSTLLSILRDWVNIGVDKIFKRSEMGNIGNFLEYAEVELAYGLDVLKYMQKRIDTLLISATSIPDPPSNLLSGLSGQRNFFRDRLNDAGNKVLRRLEALESEIAENYDIFTLCRRDLELNIEEFPVKQLEAMALNVISNSYVKISEDYSKLNSEIENFRNNVRDFCTDIDNFL